LYVGAMREIKEGNASRVEAKKELATSLI